MKKEKIVQGLLLVQATLSSTTKGGARKRRKLPGPILDKPPKVRAFLSIIRISLLPMTPQTKVGPDYHDQTYASRLDQKHENLLAQFSAIFGPGGFTCATRGGVRNA